MERRARGLVVGIAIASAAGCGWLQTGQSPQRTTQVADGIASDVSVVGTPFHRLIVSASEGDDTSRVVVLFVRVESTAEAPFWVRPGEITLVNNDGTVGVALDRERARALLERSDVVVVDADPAARDPSGQDRTAVAQQAIRHVILDELLDEAAVQRDQPVRGYVVLDMRRAQSSLDGTTLQVGLTRSADGAQMRQRYRFDAAGVAAADTPAGSAQ